MNNHRLMWNFELAAGQPLVMESIPHYPTDIIRWETRFFWPELQCITLHGLSGDFLDLANYEFKNRTDSYYLLPDGDLNLKKRREELIYKPLINTDDGCFGYGKKVDLLSETPTELVLADPVLTVAELINKLRAEGQLIHVEKTVAKCKLPTQPAIKLEFARLNIRGEVFFSFCVEGRSLELVKYLRNHLIKGAIACDYIHFLRYNFLP